MLKVTETYNYKKLVGELLGAAIAIVWISFALLGAGNTIFLVVAISLTILFGTLSGGLIAVSNKEVDYKTVISWLFGASIAVVWIAFAFFGAGDMLFLVVAISLTLVFGIISGGLIKLGTNTNDSTK
ncbi:MAG: hypothetical protein ACTSQL_02840 [Promethearchaeota archaeon]